MINLTEVVTKSPQSKKNQTINLAILWPASYSIADRLRSFFTDSRGSFGKKKEKKKKKKPRRMMRKSLKRCVNRRKENIENQAKPRMRKTHISRNIEEKARQGKSRRKTRRNVANNRDGNGENSIRSYWTRPSYQLPFVPTTRSTKDKIILRKRISFFHRSQMPRKSSKDLCGRKVLNK